MLELSRNLSWIKYNLKKTDAFKWQSFKKVKKYSVVCKFHVMVDMHALPVRLQFVSLFVSTQHAKMIIRLKQQHSATAIRASLVLPLPSPFLPLSLFPLLGLQQDLMRLLTSQALFYRWPCPLSLSASPPVCLLCVSVLCSCTLALISIVMLI